MTAISSRSLSEGGGSSRRLAVRASPPEHVALHHDGMGIVQCRPMGAAPTKFPASLHVLVSQSFCRSFQELMQRMSLFTFFSKKESQGRGALFVPGQTLPRTTDEPVYIQGPPLRNPSLGNQALLVGLAQVRYSLTGRERACPATVPCLMTHAWSWVSLSRVVRYPARHA